ncbi:iron dicitrate transporter FecR [Adhaeribacter aerolatus]|uniref:Iron dicitrate transporter FecR n=1 Tax=Adhaeribacter aerolatus TaxID=670289 RepID=A0A512AUS7_9BACT|nr:FecR family protein [Adhaeribacter aerolatus]GEO03472.1 iron dicitrate transporter FecR [Adhaeribacter aerolatus]
MDSQLIQKYFEGKCTPEEVKQVLAWFRRGETDATVKQDIENFWKQAATAGVNPVPRSSPAQLLAKINATIGHQENKASTQAGQERKIIPLRLRLKQKGWHVAAAVLLPLLLVGLYLFFFRAEPTRIVVVQTGAGQQREIKLPDGSRVTLNAQSKLTYHVPFGRQRRELDLTGEAFFEVARDTAHPFIVRTGKIATQALGTSFNINYRSNDPVIRVALVTGKVSVTEQINGAAEQTAILVPGRQLSYHKQNRQVQQQAFHAKEALGWRNGLLYFRNADLQQIITRLENWYGVEIQLSGQLPAGATTWQYSGEYDQASLDKVLTGIGFVKDFTYERNGNKVILRFN